MKNAEFDNLNHLIEGKTSKPTIPAIKKQLDECLDLLTKILGPDLLAVYLYGSALVGGLQKYSDIDLLVVTNRATTIAEKRELLKLQIHENHKIDLIQVIYAPRLKFCLGCYCLEEK